MRILKTSRAHGFTLLEVMITVGLLMMLSFAAGSLMRSNIDVRLAVAEDARVTHRLAIAMDRIAQDLQHCFIIKSLDQVRNPSSRFSKTLFKLDVSRNSELSMTTRNHKPLLANSRESSLTYVIYRIEEDPERPGIANLYRGTSPFIPANFRDEPPLRVLAKSIKSLQIEAWRGDRWIKENWDSSRSQMKDLLPHMVRVTLEAYDFDPVINDDGSSDIDLEKVSTTSLRSIIHLRGAIGMEEKKLGARSARVDKFE